MKEGLKVSLSVGAFSTLLVYVAGFTWQYTYLGVITNDIGWIRVVTTDYIHQGVMAIMFVMKPWQIIFFVALAAAVFSGFFDGLITKVWNDLPHKYKLKLHSLFRFAHMALVNNITAKRFVAVFCAFIFFISLMLEISAVSAQHMAQRLVSAGVDKICDQEETCHEGKVLYIGDKQIYFYIFDGEVEVTNGMLALLSVTDWKVFMGWNEKGREVINKHIAAGS